MVLRVTLKPSRRLGVVLFAAHLAAATVLLPLTLPVWAKVLIAFGIAVSLGHTLWRHAWLRSAASVTAIELHEGAVAGVETRIGKHHEARVLDTTYVSAALCILNLRIAGSSFTTHAIVVSDNVYPEDFRQLRVRLRWGYRREAEIRG